MANQQNMMGRALSTARFLLGKEGARAKADSERKQGSVTSAGPIRAANSARQLAVTIPAVEQLINSPTSQPTSSRGTPGYRITVSPRALDDPEESPSPSKLSTDARARRRVTAPEYGHRSLDSLQLLELASAASKSPAAAGGQRLLSASYPAPQHGNSPRWDRTAGAAAVASVPAAANYQQAMYQDRSAGAGQWATAQEVEQSGSSWDASTEATDSVASALERLRAAKNDTSNSCLSPTMMRRRITADVLQIRTTAAANESTTPNSRRRTALERVEESSILTSVQPPPAAAAGVGCKGRVKFDLTPTALGDTTCSTSSGSSSGITAAAVSADNWLVSSSSNSSRVSSPTLPGAAAAPYRPVMQQAPDPLHASNRNVPSLTAAVGGKLQSCVNSRGCSSSHPSVAASPRMLGDNAVTTGSDIKLPALARPQTLPVKPALKTATTAAAVAAATTAAAQPSNKALTATNRTTAHHHMQHKVHIRRPNNHRTGYKNHAPEFKPWIAPVGLINERVLIAPSELDSTRYDKILGKLDEKAIKADNKGYVAYPSRLSDGSDASAEGANGVDR